ncbi:sugar phosphate isomerase/epimerase family protein [Bauldia sp.]|uniref:sugar phosphate isomerase/epimerase family protein n=1 Tax=Bauldia sp. TaxID=2575872 RepID=UPI003BAAF1EB
MAYPIAFQLYSSRLFPPVTDHLPILKAMGYDAIEPWPPAYEDDPAAFRRHLDDAGLGCFGFHMPLAGLISEPNRYIEIAQILGARYLIPPFVPKEERRNTTDFWRCIGEDLATGAERAGRYGLRVAWHNHDFEYQPLDDGSRPIEHILGTGDDTVGFEIDCGWVKRAGVDPASELELYAARIIAIQTKDLASPATEEDDGWTATGDGVIDWPELAPLFRQTAADHIVTEHDNPSDWQRFAERSIRYLREIGL